jgi:tRNA G18 (ribose-2'-O)-methylase SpoU
METPMTPRRLHRIESDGNPRLKVLKKALSGRGIRKYGAVIVSGSKAVHDVVAAFPDRCEAWIATDGQPDPPDALPAGVPCLLLARRLFRSVDVFGTDAPMVLVGTPAIPDWRVDDGLPDGCSLLVPFQDPENVGAVIRSAVAFGVDMVILLAGSGHPFHPKAVRASGGAVFHSTIMSGPAIDELPRDLPVVPLSAEGTDIATFPFPARFGLLPGREGPGLPVHLRTGAVSIPMSSRLESLNAAAATAVALYVWSRSRRR